MNKYLTDNDIISLLTQCGFDRSTSSYIGNSIPDKKARNARTSMVIPYGINILGLFDDTLFGSGKDGFCICSNGIYFKVYLEQAGVIYYNELSNMNLSKSSVGINAGIYTNIKFGSGTELFYKIIEILQIYFKLDFATMNNGKISVSLNKVLDLYNNKEYSDVIGQIQEIEKYFSESDIPDIMLFYQLKISTLLELDELDQVNALIKKHKSKFTSEVDRSYLTQAENYLLFKMINNNKPAYRQLANMINQRMKQLRFWQNVIEEGESCYIENDFKQGLELLDLLSTEISQAPNILKMKYYKVYIQCCTKLEHVNIADQYLKQMISQVPEQTELIHELKLQINEMKELIEERYLNEKRSEYNEQLCIAKMYEKYGEYESAFDTISIAGESLPLKLTKEIHDNIRYKVEFLIAFYEYEQAKELIELAELPSEDTNKLEQLIHNHAKEHVEDNYQHKYSEANRLLRLGKIEKAESVLTLALSLKDTFEAKCCEINISLLRLDYRQARKQLDELSENVNKKYEVDAITSREALNNLEDEYRNMLQCIADLLKKEMMADNIQYFRDNRNQFKDFIDNDGNNLSMLAVIHYNPQILDVVREIEQFNAVNKAGQGIGVMAAAKLNEEEYMEFLSELLDDENFSDYMTKGYKENVHEAGTYEYMINEISNVFSGLKWKEDSDEEETLRIIKDYFDKASRLIYHNLQNVLCDTMNDTMRNTLKERLLQETKAAEDDLQEAILHNSAKLKELEAGESIETAKLEQEYLDDCIRKQVEEKGEFEKDEDYIQRKKAFIKENEKRFRAEACVQWKNRYEKVHLRYNKEKDELNKVLEGHKNRIQSLERQAKAIEIAKDIALKYYTFAPKAIEIQKYNANEEYFDIQYFGVKGRLPVPIDVAKKFKEDFDQITIDGAIHCNDIPEGFEVIYRVVFIYGNQEYTCILQKEVKYIDVRPLIEEINLLKDKHNQQVEEELAESDDSDDKTYDDESYDDESCDDESCDDESYDKESYDKESYDKESYDEESYDEESYDYEVCNDNNAEEDYDRRDRDDIKEAGRNDSMGARTTASDDKAPDETVDSEVNSKGGLLSSPEMQELLASIGEMTRAERGEFKKSLASLGFDPMKLVKINLAINRIESKELSEMCANIESMPLEKLKKLKDKIERGNYNPAISEDFIDEIDELIENLE